MHTIYLVLTSALSKAVLSGLLCLVLDRYVRQQQVEMSTVMCFCTLRQCSFALNLILAHAQPKRWDGMGWGVRECP